MDEDLPEHIREEIIYGFGVFLGKEEKIILVFVMNQSYHMLKTIL